MKTGKQIERRIMAIEADVDRQGPVIVTKGSPVYRLGLNYGALYALGWVLGGWQWPRLITKARGNRKEKAT